MSFDPENPKPTDLEAIVATFSDGNTRRIVDYMNGYQLSPQRPLTILGADGKVIGGTGETDISYWTGDLLPKTAPGYPAQVQAIRRSFTFRNVLREGIELLADGIGADEADWSFVVERPLADGERPNEQEQALIDEIESVATAWWDERDLPSFIQTAVIGALAHGNQPVRPRIPARYIDRMGRLSKREAAKSLDPLHLVMPEPGDAGIYQDPDTMERYGVTRVWTGGQATLKTEWEVSSLDDQERTVVRVVDSAGGVTTGQPLDLGGLLYLLNLKMPRRMITPDALGVQDARNVGTTAMSRNTRYAVFEKTLFIGLDPALDEDGRPRPINGAGAEAWLAPSQVTEVEDTGRMGEDGEPVTITRTKLYPGASVTKLSPDEPKAIQAAIDQATADLYGILRQQFMLIAGDATASGRSRETSTGPYLRAVARCATAVESFIRDILTLAMRVSAIVQGQPNRYDGLRPSVTCRQKIFEPSADTIRIWLELWKAGAISRQTLQTTAGIADPDAEQQIIEKEETSRPEQQTTTPPVNQVDQTADQ
ncbi:hypothetical protein [Deinococcus fonticola]|uniref:hypothetical protein n=1 Tax=Deinococcus fonticola TaxID=2528713 RepID=UPI001074E9C3|nr:hypothetical protein [Deinococcus fonticola]